MGRPFMRATSRRRAERGHVHSVGAGRRPSHGSRPYEEPPTLKPGQVRCPVCRNGVRPNVRGFLREHRDLFGLKCYNRRPPEPD